MINETIYVWLFRLFCLYAAFTISTNFFISVCIAAVILGTVHMVIHGKYADDDDKGDRNDF